MGAGSEDFGKDGRKENGGWEKGAKGLRTGGQKSLAEVWGASKAGKKASQGKVVERANASSEDDVESLQTEEGLDHDGGTFAYHVLVHGVELFLLLQVMVDELGRISQTNSL